MVKNLNNSIELLIFLKRNNLTFADGIPKDIISESRKMKLDPLLNKKTVTKFNIKVYYVLKPSMISITDILTKIEKLHRLVKNDFEKQ